MIRKTPNFYIDLNFVEKIFFQNSTIRIIPELEGMKVEESKLFLGCRAGPEISLDNLFHEMAHLIEISDKRILKSSWGMNYQTVNFVYDREVVEPISTQALHREMKVFAIQKHLAELSGIVSDPWEEREKILHWMLDYPMIDHDSPKDYCIENMDSYYKNYSKESIMSEWTRKNVLLKEI